MKGCKIWDDIASSNKLMSLTFWLILLELDFYS